MSVPVHLTALTPREAVTDAVYRAIYGADTNDWELFNSALTPEIEFDLGGNIMHGAEEVRANLFGLIGPMDTLHAISNVRVHLTDDPTKASLTAYATNQHCRPGEGLDSAAPKYTAGVMYFMDLVKDAGDNLWKIQKWTIKFCWAQGDQSVMNRD